MIQLNKYKLHDQLFNNLQTYFRKCLRRRRKRQPRSVKLSKQKKQSKLQTLINTNNNDFCLHITHQIKETQTQSYQEIQETILTYTKAATTSPPAHSSCLMKIAYMLNVNRPILLYSYGKYIYSFKTVKAQILIVIHFIVISTSLHIFVLKVQ